MSVQPYKYSGKELDTAHGIHWLDYGARMSDVALGRWHSMDRMCEKYYDVSPYAFCHDNPVNLIDDDGNDDYRLHGNGTITFRRYTNAKSTDRIFSGNSFIIVNKSITRQLTMPRKEYNGNFAIGGKDEFPFRGQDMYRVHDNGKFVIVGSRDSVFPELWYR